MELINESQCQFATIVGRIGFPKYSLSLLVKGTFDLNPGEIVSISSDQLSPTGDEFYEDDEEMTGGPRYSSDFTYFKPRADLLLVGKCYAPEGTKVAGRQATFRIGSTSKTLNVLGNRHWKRGLLGSTASDPEPFSEMELRYDHSFGGKKYKKNPVGKGDEKIETESGKKLQPLPNIMHMDDKISSPGTKLEPSGFGPLGPMWIQRSSKLGTYKGKYLKDSWPWFPKDFDWGYFNAAPPDMQVEGYLRGDEKLYFENLHPVHPQYNTQLPGLRIRAFVNIADDTNESAIHLREVKIKLDTLWVDMEAEKLVLVWRGVTDIESEDYEEIKHVFLSSEKLGEPAQSADYYKDLLHKLLTEPEEQESYAVKPLEAEVTEEPVDVDNEIAKAEENMKASLVKAGIDPDNLPPPDKEAKEKEAQLLKELGFEEEKEEIPLTREIIQDRARRKENFTGEDLRGIDMRGLDLRGLNFHGANMSGISLMNADLSNADLTEADMSKTNLSMANLKKAVLQDADLSDADLTKVDFTGSILNDAIFEKSKLNNAVLDEVTALYTHFSESDMTGASLQKGAFEGADFSNCIMNMADFQGSNLRAANFDGVCAVQIKMSNTDLTELRASNACDFTGGSFQKAIGLESVWENAMLKDADFSFSHMEGANFTSASLENADFSCANMKFARFTKANLSGGIMRAMNLFQGSLEKATLSGTDFSGSNLYGVEFLNTIIENTKFEFTNLKMTKLSNESK